MTKNNREYFAFLDYMRAFAVLVVFLYHALLPAFGKVHLAWDGWFRDFDAPWSFLMLTPATFGWAGVPIFFAVSGFCIHLSYERSRDMRRFFARRFFRIYPPYFFALILFAFFAPWGRLHFDSLSGLTQFGAHVLLVHNLSPQTMFGINPSFWSIAVEAQLYLIFPLLIGLAHRIGWRKAMWLVGAIEFGLCGWRVLAAHLPLGTPPYWTVYCPFAYWFSWSVGAALAEAHLKGRPLPFGGRQVILWPALALAAFFVKPLSHVGFALVALATTAIISHLLARPAASRPAPRFGANRLRWLGVISYSFYLLHQPLVGFVPLLLTKAFPSTSFSPLTIYICCLAALTVIVPISWVFYRAVELPSIQLGKWFLGRKKIASALPQGALSPLKIRMDVSGGGASPPKNKGKTGGESTPLRTAESETQAA